MIIYLAGGEAMYNSFKRCNIKNVLVSYYYMREKGTRVVEKILKEFPNVFLDSGAFTLQQHLLEAKATNSEFELTTDMESYVSDYIEFIKRYGTEFKVVAEVDVGTWQQKTRYRELLEEKIPSGIKLLPVIHRSDPEIYYEYLCKNYPYVALGSLRTGRSIGEMRKYIAKRLVTPKKYGTKVHGFAVTIIELVRSFGMASVDSATWLHGSKHGMTFWFDGKRLRSYDRNQKWVRLRFKKEAKEAGISWDAFMDDSARTVDIFNLHEWGKFQRYLETEGVGLGKFKASQERFWRSKTEDK